MERSIDIDTLEEIKRKIDYIENELSDIRSQLVSIIAEFDRFKERPPMIFPVDSYGSWPEDLSLRREDIYDENGR